MRGLRQRGVVAYLGTVADGPPTISPTEPMLEYDRSENPLRDALLS